MPASSAWRIQLTGVKVLAAELIDRPKADKDELLGRVEDLLKSIQQLLKSC